MTVLVTGGTGFVGKRLQLKKPEWVYVSSKDYDLSSVEECVKMYKEVRPEAVVHLAGKVGGIKTNNENPADFYYLNTMINTNVVHQAYEHGVKRVLASLSTCVFPDVVKNYPLKEEDLFSGPPSATNLSYGYAKRSLLIQINAYRKQYDLDYSTFCPSNIYGPEDNFDLYSSHFVPALIRKCVEIDENKEIELWGDGKALRQQLYVDDLVGIIPLLLEQHHTNIPMIVAPSENLSILEMFEMLLKQIGENIKVKFNKELPGQYRKDGSNKKLLNLIGEYNFTPFEEGVRKTYEWYRQNK